ncbi:MAG: hypothetical protein HY318_14805 [Armatimonadetes bacterium]|nr:hypothetical protein [Armatimonadota bacterium]
MTKNGELDSLVTNEQYAKFLDWMKKTNDHGKCFSGREDLWFRSVAVGAGRAVSPANIGSAGALS